MGNMEIIYRLRKLDGFIRGVWGLSTSDSPIDRALGAASLSVEELINDIEKFQSMMTDIENVEREKNDH